MGGVPSVGGLEFPEDGRLSDGQEHKADRWVIVAESRRAGLCGWLTLRGYDPIDTRTEEAQE